jgi:hypothetical protein
VLPITAPRRLRAVDVYGAKDLLDRGDPPADEMWGGIPRSDEPPACPIGLMGLQQRLVEASCCPSPLPVSTLILPGP